MQKNGKVIKCKYCGKGFYISSSRIGKKKYCSRKCSFDDNIGFKPIKKSCIICGKQFIVKSQLRINDKTCSHDCWYQNNRNLSKKSKANMPKKKKEDWKSYKDGKHCDRGRHTRECARYREEFREKNGYLFCELCLVNINGTPRFETHHIVYASEAPKHEYLHDNRNLILLCTNCHRWLHTKKSNRESIMKRRGLKKLFNKQ